MFLGHITSRESLVCYDVHQLSWELQVKKQLSHRSPQGCALVDILVSWNQEAISSVQLTCVLAFISLFIVGAPNDCYP